MYKHTVSISIGDSYNLEIKLDNTINPPLIFINFDLFTDLFQLGSEILRKRIVSFEKYDYNF